MLRHLLVVAVLVVPAFGQSLVSAPAPQQRFWDRPNKVAIAVTAAIRFADVGQTCYHLGKGWREVGLHIQSCHGIVLYGIAEQGAQTGVTWLLYRAGLHRLERIAPYLWVTPNAAGIGYSFTR